jgi:hypothetical protein
MEGVDEILARSKAVVKRVHPDDNGTTQAQAPSIYHWFGSKSTQKVHMPLTVVTSIIDGLKRMSKKQIALSLMLFILHSKKQSFILQIFCHTGRLIYCAR